MSGSTGSTPARAAFLCACQLDVAVRKPGNVSLASPGHGMTAAQFTASAQAAAVPLFAPGQRVGARIEAAMRASWSAAGCNTNLGILLLCAPIAAAVERFPQARDVPALRGAIERVLAELDLDDAAATYRAIALAQPGGLGDVPAQDVRRPPSIGLREAMALAADRDSIARQYANGFAELFEIALAALPAGWVPPMAVDAQALDSATTAAVQGLYLALLSHQADSHIVRKHGVAVAQTVMRSAQALRAQAQAGAVLDALPAFAAWDAELKAAGINPGTSADFTVAALLLAALVDRPPARA
jgi:triphosphoribosyl-dephospho-CoA synthase